MKGNLARLHRLFHCFCQYMMVTPLTGPAYRREVDWQGGSGTRPEVSRRRVMVRVPILVLPGCCRSGPDLAVDAASLPLLLHDGQLVNYR